MQENHPKTQLDCTGLLCPLPVLKARKALGRLAVGDVLEVTATDPMAAIDIPHFCTEQGHLLLSQTQTDKIFHFRIRKMAYDFGAFNNWGALQKVAVRHPRNAFVSDAKINAEWRDLNFHSRPDLKRALKEFDAAEKILKDAGADVIHLPASDKLTLDALYTHDALIVTPKGLVKPRMGKPQRRAESEVNGDALAKLGIPIAGEITGSGKIEGGDMIWIDRKNLCVGIGYRTNLEGVRQLQEIVGSETTVHWFDLPFYKGPTDVFHLMSVISPLDEDLALVYRPLMPVRLVEFLEARGVKFVEVPDHEFPSMGCNVLALGPRHAMMVNDNPITHKRMLEAGVNVHVISGDDICRKGEGGPTCMTRPLVRS